MSTFRINKTKDYTVMSNHHLHDDRLSFGAKGLLSFMLSLPDDWDYTLSGLAKISKEGIDAIRTMVRELENCGYIVRQRDRDEKGRLGGSGWCVYEKPIGQLNDLPAQDRPAQEEPTLENPTLGEPTQINTNILNTNIPSMSRNVKRVEREDTKKKKSKKEKSDELLESLLPKYELSPVVKEKVRKWIKYKSERNEHYKETGLDTLLGRIENRCLRYGDKAVCEIMDDSMSSGWSGIIFDRLEAKKNQAQAQERNDPYAKRPKYKKLD